MAVLSFLNAIFCSAFLFATGVDLTSSGCPQNWYTDATYSNICYQQSSKSDNFQDALAYCQLSGASLPSFHTVEEYISYQELIMLYYLNVNFQCDLYIWLGISSANISSWVDGTAVTLSYYNNVYSSSTSCTTHLTTGGSWLYVPCTDTYNYVCQLRLSFNTSIITSQNVSCPNGWYPDIYGICYLKIDNFMSWDCAEAYCETMSATLPRFNNNSELAAYYTVTKKSFLQCKTVQWLGFYDQNSTGTFRWIDGNFIAASDANWWFQNGNFGPGNVRGCSYGWFYDTSYYATNTTDNRQFYCQLRMGNNNFSTIDSSFISDSSACNFSTTTMASTSTFNYTMTGSTNGSPLTSATPYSASFCPNGWMTDTVHPYICYLMPGVSKNFSEASAYCNSNLSGATLPVFHYQDEYDSYHRLMMRLSGIDCSELYWLGVSNQPPYPNQKLDKWVDGTNITFTYWSSTSFDCTLHYATGGAWQTAWCGMLTPYRFVCQLRLTYYTGSTIGPLSTSPLPSYCPSGWTADIYGICYKFFSGPSIWDQAQKNCQIYPGGSLAQFCNDAEQTSMNNILPAMFVPCNTWFWVGIYDPVGDGSFQYINGSYVGKNGFLSFQCDSTKTRVASSGWQYNTSSFVAYSTTVTGQYVCQIRPSNDCLTNKTYQTTSSPLCQLPTSTTTTTIPTTTKLTTTVIPTTLTSSSTVVTPSVEQSITTNISILPNTTTLVGGPELFVTKDGNFSHHGRVLYVTLNLSGQEYNIYRYSPDNIKDQHSFFSEDGKSVKRSLLRNLVKFMRISSHYGMPGIPSFTIVGLADKTIADSKERVRAALSSIGLTLPTKKILLNPLLVDVANELVGLAEGVVDLQSTHLQFTTTDSLEPTSTSTVEILEKTDQSSDTTELTTAYAESNFTSTLSLTAQSSSLIDLGIEPIDGNDNVALLAKVMDTTTFVIQPLNDSMKQQLGYTFEQLVVSSSFNSVPCGSPDFQDLYNPQLGNCYIFNAGENPQHWITHSGSTYGLRLVLAALQSEYTCTSSYAGFRLVIHENNIIPFPDAQGYNIGLGTVTLINIREERLSKLGYPYGNCASSSYGQFIKNYSVEACQRYCFQNVLVRSCHCADPRYPLPNQENYCSIDQKACLDFYQACESTVTESCNCPAPCNERIYSATLTIGKFMDKALKEMFCNQTSDSTDCYDQAENDFSVVYVYYQEMTALIQTEYSAYGWYNAFCDFSNILGTLLGIGIITFVEFCLMLLWVIMSGLKSIQSIFL